MQCNDDGASKEVLCEVAIWCIAAMNDEHLQCSAGQVGSGEGNHLAGGSDQPAAEGHETYVQVGRHQQRCHLMLRQHQLQLD